MVDLCANLIVHDLKPPAATTTIVNCGRYRICDACAAMLVASRDRGDVLSRNITVRREAKPAAFGAADFIDPTPAEKAAQDALNVELRAAMAVAAELAAERFEEEAKRP